MDYLYHLLSDKCFGLIYFLGDPNLYDFLLTIFVNIFSIFFFLVLLYLLNIVTYLRNFFFNNPLLYLYLKPYLSEKEFKELAYFFYMFLTIVEILLKSFFILLLIFLTLRYPFIDFSAIKNNTASSWRFTNIFNKSNFYSRRPWMPTDQLYRPFSNEPLWSKTTFEYGDFTNFKTSRHYIHGGFRYVLQELHYFPNRLWLTTEQRLELYHALFFDSVFDYPAKDVRNKKFWNWYLSLYLDEWLPPWNIPGYFFPRNKGFANWSRTKFPSDSYKDWESKLYTSIDNDRFVPIEQERMFRDFSRSTGFRFRKPGYTNFLFYRSEDEIYPLSILNREAFYHYFGEYSNRYERLLSKEFEPWTLHYSDLDATLPLNSFRPIFFGDTLYPFDASQIRHVVGFPEHNPAHDIYVYFDFFYEGKKYYRKRSMYTDDFRLRGQYAVENPKYNTAAAKTKEFDKYWKSYYPHSYYSSAHKYPFVARKLSPLPSATMRRKWGEHRAPKDTPLRRYLRKRSGTERLGNFSRENHAGATQFYSSSSADMKYFGGYHTPFSRNLYNYKFRLNSNWPPQFDEHDYSRIRYKHINNAEDWPHPDMIDYFMDPKTFKTTRRRRYPYPRLKYINNIWWFDSINSTTETEFTDHWDPRGIDPIYTYSTNIFSLIVNNFLAYIRSSGDFKSYRFFSSSFSQSNPKSNQTYNEALNAYNKNKKFWKKSFLRNNFYNWKFDDGWRSRDYLNRLQETSKLGLNSANYYFPFRDQDTYDRRSYLKFSNRDRLRVLNKEDYDIKRGLKYTQRLNTQNFIIRIKEAFKAKYMQLGPTTIEEFFSRNIFGNYKVDHLPNSKRLNRFSVRGRVYSKKKYGGLRRTENFQQDYRDKSSPFFFGNVEVPNKWSYSRRPPNNFRFRKTKNPERLEKRLENFFYLYDYSSELFRFIRRYILAPVMYFIIEYIEYWSYSYGFLNNNPSEPYPASVYEHLDLRQEKGFSYPGNTINFYSYRFRSLYFFRKLYRLLIAKLLFVEPGSADSDFFRRFNRGMKILFGNESMGDEISDFTFLTIKTCFFSYLRATLGLLLVFIVNSLSKILECAFLFIFYHPFFVFVCIVLFFVFYYRISPIPEEYRYFIRMFYSSSIFRYKSRMKRFFYYIYDSKLLDRILKIKFVSNYFKDPVDPLARKLREPSYSYYSRVSQVDILSLIPFHIRYFKRIIESFFSLVRSLTFGVLKPEEWFYQLVASLPRNIPPQPKLRSIVREKLVSLLKTVFYFLKKLPRTIVYRPLKFIFYRLPILFFKKISVFPNNFRNFIRSYIIHPLKYHTPIYYFLPIRYDEYDLSDLNSKLNSPKLFLRYRIIKFLNSVPIFVKFYTISHRTITLLRRVLFFPLKLFFLLFRPFLTLRYLDLRILFSLLRILRKTAIKVLLLLRFILKRNRLKYLPRIRSKRQDYYSKILAKLRLLLTPYKEIFSKSFKRMLIKILEFIRNKFK